MAPLISLFSVLMTVVNVMLAVHWLQMHRRLMSPLVQQVYRYGKTLHSIQSATSAKSEPEASAITTFLTMTVPKSSFRFFYVVALILNVGAFIQSEQLEPLICLLFRRDKVTYSGLTPYLLIWCLEVVQVVRRGYECFFVSVYSPSSRINVYHLISGFGFYAGVALIITNYAFSDTGSQPVTVSFVSILFGLIFFAVGSLVQCRSHVTLAGLRRRTRPDGKRLIVTYDHMIPYGHLFQLVSNPHYLAEVMIYAAFLLISHFDFTFLLLFLYVLLSHMIMAEQSHQWYQEKFKKLYPSRAVLIPCVY